MEHLFDGLFYYLSDSLYDLSDYHSNSPFDCFFAYLANDLFYCSSHCLSGYLFGLVVNSLNLVASHDVVILAGYNDDHSE